MLVARDHPAMSVGSLVGLLTALTGLGGDFAALAKHIMSLTRARPSLQRIYRFLDRPEVPAPAPQSVLRTNNHQLRRMVSRTEMLLSRMDADPIVQITNCGFRYGLHLLAGAKRSGLDVDAAEPLQTMRAPMGYFTHYLSFVLIGIVAMTSVAHLYPSELDNGADVQETCSGSQSGGSSSPATELATVNECINRMSATTSATITDWKDSTMNAFTACLQEPPTSSEPSFEGGGVTDDGLTVMYYMVILSYACTILFLSCGFAWFIKVLTGLYPCPCRRKRLGVTNIRAKLAHKDRGSSLDRSDLMAFNGNFRAPSERASTGASYRDDDDGRSRRKQLQQRISAGEGRMSRGMSHRLSLAGSSSGADDEPTIFEGLTLNISRGELIVLCGEAAFGKTTLFRLLTKTNEPESGQVDIRLGAVSTHAIPTTT